MKVPLSWLRRLASIGDDVDADEIAQRMHDLGLLIEEIERPIALEHIVVGEVVACHEIPGAEKVQLVDVADGSGTREVVCGAFNFGPGDKVPLALPGAKLPNGMAIAERHIKSLDVTSHGMLCAEDELGLGDDHSGILVLDGDAVTGSDFVAAAGLDETVIELEITPNRPDCMGMIGVAREVAASFGVAMNVPEVDVAASAPEISAVASVRVETPRGCPRYAATVVEDVEIGPSPAWLVAGLRSNGIRSINNIVDVTNYVLLETGQPIHAFDLDRIAGSEIVVREAEEGEVVQTLDEIDRKMSAGDVLICDGEKPVAIGGIMGGGNSEVSESTTRILIEAAHFEAPRILATSKRLGLRTDASARFERGVDPGLPAKAALRVAQLVTEVAGGSAREGVIDVVAAEIEPSSIALRTERVNRILGTKLGAAQIKSLLEAIEIREVDAGTDRATYAIPSWRPDLEREIDLVEEVARLYGYNSIARTLPSGPERIGGLSAEQVAVRRVRSLLRAAGLHDAHTTSFVSDAMYERLGWEPQATVDLANPLREEDRHLRTSLVPTLLSAAAYNAARNSRDIRLAEIGHVYLASRDDASGLPDEPERIGIVLSGVDNDARVHAGGQGRRFDVFDAKGALETVFEGLGLSFDVDPAAEVPKGLHPARSAGVRLDGGQIGFLGELHPRVADAWDVAASTELAEIDLAPVIAAYLARETEFGSIPTFPPIYFSAAFIVGTDVEAADLGEVLRAHGGDLLTDVALFDEFHGEGLGDGKKSLAYEFTFQSFDRTLSDDDVRPVVDEMVATAADRFGAILRG